MQFTEYEEHVVEEIVRHDLEPNMVEKALELIGVPFEKLLKEARESQSPTLQKITTGVEKGIANGLVKSIGIANKVYRDETVAKKYAKRGIVIQSVMAVRDIELEIMDDVARSYSFANATLLTAEGIATGGATTLGEIIPFAQFVIPVIVAGDVVTSITMLTRNTCQVAASYGYSSKDPENIPHIISALAPQEHTSDEGFLTAKGLVINAIREAGGFMAEKAGKTITLEMMEKEAPQLIRLILYISERLGFVLTEKSLGILVPVAGAAINGSINLAFQQYGHILAMDYFRRLTLENKYGAKAVTDKIQIYKQRHEDETAA